MGKWGCGVGWLYHRPLLGFPCSCPVGYEAWRRLRAHRAGCPHLAQREIWWLQRPVLEPDLVSQQHLGTE